MDHFVGFYLSEYKQSHFISLVKSGDMVVEWEGQL